MKTKIYTILLGLFLFTANSALIAQNTTCPDPTGTATTLVTTTSATVTWAAFSATGYYKVQYRPVTLATTNWTQVYAQTNSYVITGLTCGTAYEWQVQSICANSGGTAASSAFSASLIFTTSACAPPTCNAPTGMITQAIGANNATASWTAVSGVIAYRIQYRPITVALASWTQITVQGSSYMLSNLACGIAYEWQVQSLCNTSATGGTSAYSASSNFTTLTCPPICETPVPLPASNISAVSATLTWSVPPPSNPAYYLLRYRPVNTLSWISVTVQANQSFTLTALSCATNYEWQVQSMCTASGGVGGSSLFSVPSTFTTLACPPPACNAPSGLAASNISTTNAVLTWIAPVGAIYYKLQYRPLSPANANWTQVTVTANSSFSLSALTCGTAYEWQVQSICSSATNGGSSTFSSSANFTTLACTPVCAAPSGTQTSGITSSGAALTWLAPAGVSVFNLQYRLVTNSFTNWTQVIVQGNSFVLSNLICNALYEWQVQSICSTSPAGGGNSAYSSSTTFTTLPCLQVCIAPAGLTASNLSAAGVTLTWAVPVPSPSNYILQYRPSNTLTWNIVTVQANQSYTLTGLSCATNYEWQVQSHCANSGTLGGSSAFTVGPNFSTLTCPPPACVPPTGLSTSAIAANSAQLSWIAPLGAVYYKIQYRPLSPANSNWTQVYVTASSSYTLSGLTCATGYEWQVQSICSTVASGASAFTGSANFTTLACPPICAVPSGLATNGVTTSGAVVSWTPVVGVSVYNLQYRLVTNVVTNWTQVTTQGISYTLANLYCAALYEWRVASVCSNNPGTSVISNFSPSSTFTALPCVNVCPVPSGLTSGNITTSSAYIGWPAIAGVISYRVQYRALLPNVPPSNPWTQVTVQLNTLTLTNLVCATNYEWRVQSICSTVASGTSAFSASSFFTTAPCVGFCAAPSNLMATNITPQSSLLKWSSAAPSIGYSIRYRKLNATAWTMASSTTTSKQLNGLVAQSYYEWQVQSICNAAGATTAASVSVWSSSSYFNTHFVVTIGPNPADRLIKVEMELDNADETALIELRNILGAVVFRTDKSLSDGKNELEIATSSFAEGLYFLNVIGASGKQVLKVYIRH